MILNFFKKNSAPDRQPQFEELFMPHMGSLYGIACGWTSDTHAAEDLVQELAIKVSQRVAEMRTIEKLHPWLVTIMYRMFVDSYRRQKNSPVTLVGKEQLHELENHEDHAVDFDDALDNEQLKVQLRVALNRLEPELRATLVLFELEGYSLKDIAEIQGIGLGTVKSRLHRAKDKLKNSLNWEPFGNEPRVNK